MARLQFKPAAEIECKPLQGRWRFSASAVSTVEHVHVNEVSQALIGM
jgi:hypothetical protein